MISFCARWSDKKSTELTRLCKDPDHSTRDSSWKLRLIEKIFTGRNHFSHSNRKHHSNKISTKSINRFCHNFNVHTTIGNNEFARDWSMSATIEYPESGEFKWSIWLLKLSFFDEIWALINRFELLSTAEFRIENRPVFF